MANKSGSFSKGVVWIILLLLIVGLGGFGISNFGGSAQSVGSVGDREISANDYFRGVQQEIRAMSAQTGQTLSFEQANQFSQFAFGAPLTDRVLTQLITTAALDGEVDRIGLSIGDEQLRDRLVNNPAFQGLDGAFDRETYRNALRQIGLNERDYETSIREDNARGMLQAAVIGGLVMPSQMVDSFVSYHGQRRNFSVIHRSAEDLSVQPPAPTEAELLAYYENNPAPYTAPPVKSITFAWITPDMLLDTIEVDEETLRSLYEERSAEFNSPERRLVERLVFSDMETASDAAERLTAGATDFDALVAERGLTLDDIDMGDVSIDELAVGAAAAVFTLEGPGITDVVQSALGPALFRVNAVLDSQTIPFEDARADLLDEHARDRARRVVDGMAEEVDNLLVGGATLEELAAETELELGQIEWSEGLDQGIAGYDDFRRIARAVDAEDFPELATLDDGGLFALRLDETRDERLKPFDEVRETVTEDWTKQEIQNLLLEQADALADQLRLGVTADELGLSAETFVDQTRDLFIEGVPRAFIAELFAAAEGEVRVFDAGDAVLIGQLAAVMPPDMENEDTRALQTALTDDLDQGLAQDIFIAFARDAEARAGLALNQAALNAVHAQIP